MRKRARSVLTGLLVLCCAFAGLMPVVHVQADSSGTVGRDIVITENAGLMRTAYPVAVPFVTESAVTDWRLADPTGDPISCSVEQTDTGAVVLRFLADLPANSTQTFKLITTTGSPATGVTQLPLFMGTSYLVYVEKILEVASFQADNLVTLVRSDGTPLVTRTLALEESMSYTTASPQVVRIAATKPVSAWLVTMTPDSQAQALRDSSDDVYGAVGSDLLIRTFGQIWLAAPSSTSVSLTRKGTTRTIELLPGSVQFVDGLEPGIYRLRSPSPVCITSGVEEDNVSCVQYPVGTWFAGPSFGQTTLTSWRPGTMVTASFEETTQTSLLPTPGSFAARTTIAQNAFAEGKTEWKPIVVKSNGPYLLTTDGNSGNFGLEQYPSTTLGGSGLNFVVISGKIFSGFSRGHFRRLAIVGVQDGAEVTMSTGTSSQRFSLNTAQAKIVRIDAGSIPILLTSTKPVQMFDLGEEAREGIAVALPLADSSVTASVAKVSSSIPGVSAGTDEATNANTAAESPSSGPWQTAWTWMQKATRSVGTWIQTAARSTGAFFASLYASIRDFFVSGQALRILQSVTQSINDLAVRLFLPLSALVLPILKRVAPSASMTPELVAVWMFWIIVVLALIILILALRPRHNAGKRLPRVTPRVPGHGENPIDFGPVEQGPQPSPAASLNQLARTREKQEMPPVQEVVSKPAIVEEPSPARLESPSVPEISLEPLGFFGEAETAPTASTDTAAVIVPAVAPLLEFTPPEVEPPTAQVEPSEIPPTISEPSPPDVPLEALLTPPQEDLSALEVPAAEQPAQEAFSVPELRPIGEEAPIQIVESESHVPDTVMPLDQPLPVENASMTEATFETKEAPVPEAPAIPLAASIEESGSAQETNASIPVEAVPVEAESKTAVAPSSADLLSRLLDDEQSFERTMVTAGAAASAPASSPPFAVTPARKPAPQPSVFSGDVELDVLLHDGVVADAGALAQLFSGGYRNRISKLAVSAKDLQNVPEEMRQVIKLTVVALSPIELSIARDLAMRLEAPGFVGEALLVAKKMGYENYLTTYKNVSKNYKDVSIVETDSLKVPEVSAESSGDLISFS
ncbi:MAG: hypothetical protein WAW16_08820 [Candidatus Cryosericum sp.]